MAARTEDRKFGTFALTTTANGVNVLEWQERILHRTEYKPRLKSDGSLLVQDRYEGREIELSGQVTGDDTGDVRDKLDALLKNLANAEQFLSLFDDRRILCRLDGDVPLAFIPDSGLVRLYEWEASFRSRWHTWEATTGTSDSWSTSGVGPHTRALPNNAGTAPSYPKITVTNNGASFSDKTITLTNTNTGAQWSMGGFSMNAGQSLIMEFREGRLGDGTGIPITPTTVEGEWWTLAASAITTLQIDHTIGSGSSLAWVVSWNAQYWAL